jgi:large subunit ribosomal protein L17
MRHLKAGRKLNRNAEHRIALMRNLTRALLEHERIITTVEKAKEAKRYIERTITLAKRGGLHARRLVMMRLGPVAKVTLYDKKDEPTEDTVITKLFKDVVPRFKDRHGGYTRVIKRHQRRLGDAGHTAFLELLKEGEKKVRAKAKAAPAPAPKVSEEKAEKKPEKPAEAPTAEEKKAE